MKEEKAKVTSNVKPVVSPVTKPVIKAAVPVKVEAAATKEPAKLEVTAAKAPAKAAKAVTKTKKASAKKAPAKKAPAKKADSVKENICIEYANKSYSTEALMKIIKDIWKYDLKKKAGDMGSVELYVKTEESKVYYVVNGTVTGEFEI